jgi:hypothetical protein
MRKIIFALAALLAATTVSAVSFPTGGKFKNLAQNNQQKLAEAESRESNLVSKLSLSQIGGDSFKLDLSSEDDEVTGKLVEEPILRAKFDEFRAGFSGEETDNRVISIKDLQNDLDAYAEGKFTTELDAGYKVHF